MKIKKSNIPVDSLINKYQPYDYRDSFECLYTTDKSITPDDIQVTFWTDMPAFVKALFKLRNILVKPFGLKSDQKNKLEEFETRIRSGGNYKYVSVPDKTPSETILCLDDKHLRAYLSVHVESLGNNTYKARCITIVQFKYWFGKAYFYVICPFHYIVVKATFKYAMKKLV